MTDPSSSPPHDDHDRRLTERVRPPDWRNPVPSERYNLVVIGGGTAGLVAAMGAAGLGARVALVERERLGGDCLNTGCVPSKALLASAHLAHEVRRARTHGVQAAFDGVDFAAAMARMRRLRAGIALHDSAGRLQEAGVDVFFGDAVFHDRDVVDVDGARLRFARACIATGAEAVRPPIPGIDEAPVVTHEQFFECTTLPERFLVIGAGPIGCELGQALARLGSRVTVVDQADRLLPAEEPEASAALSASFTADGIDVRLGQTVTAFRRASTGGSADTFEAVLEDGSAVPFELCLLAVGRRPRTEGLGLEAAGVEAGPDGIIVDPQLCTTNRHIFAAGDCASRYRFTHAADALARIVIQNALFLGRKRHDALTIPWATFTDPEVAHVGITWREAAERDDVLDLSRPFDACDRAICEGRTDGYLRAFCTRDGTILGATVVGDRAGDLIALLTLAMTSGAGMRGLSASVFPYPTRALEVHRLGDDWSRTRLSEPVARALDHFLRWRR
ncbi:MAG: mercuric reductase [Deltaproteobacteria bacterium]|nr:MAG: mercuric reductase [Deltaproteobacteria bacterium]